MSKKSDAPGMSDAASELLSNYASEQVRASVAALRERKILARASDEVATGSDRNAMETYLQDPRLLRDKAEQVRAVAGACKSDGARNVFLGIAANYDELAALIEARRKRFRAT